jgi:HEPN domain-containing protein
MDEARRQSAGGWLDKAQRQFETARHHASRADWSESVQASQEAIELSVKGLLTILEVSYPAAHRLSREELGKIATELRRRRVLERLKVQLLFRAARLPRLLVLANLWADSNVIAKYGIEAGFLATASELFEEPEAKLALAHADECIWAAKDLLWAPPLVLDAVLEHT